MYYTNPKRNSIDNSDIKAHRGCVLVSLAQLGLQNASHSHAKKTFRLIKSIQSEIDLADVDIDETLRDIPMEKDSVMERIQQAVDALRKHNIRSVPKKQHPQDDYTSELEASNPLWDFKAKAPRSYEEALVWLANSKLPEHIFRLARGKLQDHRDQQILKGDYCG